MSRIHDALKKAENEKQGSGVAESISLDVPLMPAMSSETEQSENARGLPLEEGLSDPIGFEASPSTFTTESLARCSKHDWKPDSARIVFSGADHTGVVGVEEFRTLRSRLFQLRERRQLRSIVVSSALPGEGKTFVSANLAHVLVRHRTKRVLLMDADLRKPSMHRILGATEKPGLSDYLRGDCTLTDAIQRGTPENLFFMPAGNSISSPAELVSGERFRHLVEEISEVFDWIVIDSPPVVPVADATQITNSCDGVLLVVQSGTTPFDLAQRAGREFPRDKLLGVVLNRMSSDAMPSSYYYHSYGHEPASSVSEG